MAIRRSRSPDEKPTETLLLLRFWAPLALIWLIMGIEQPTIGAVVSRLPRPAQSLAAFEVAFGLAALIHSPILQLLSAGTALIVDRPSHRHAFRFFLVIAGMLTALHLIVGLTSTFAVIVREVIGVPAELVTPSRHAFLALAPISAAVGLRRLLQGAMVRARTTRSVAVVTLIRLAATTLLLGLVLLLTGFGFNVLPPGGTVAAGAFTIGVVAGAIAAAVRFQRRIIPTFSEQSSARSSQPSTASGIARFYMPLALTGIVMTIGRPLLVWSITRSGQSMEALAAWPLIVAFIGVFQALGMSFQEVAVARISDQRDAVPSVRRTATLIGTGLTVIAGIFFLTPVRMLWFNVVINAPTELLSLIMPAIAIVTPMPWITTRIAMFNGILIATGRTKWVTSGMAVRILGYIGFGLFLPIATTLPGTVVAAITLVGSGILQLATGAFAIQKETPL